MNCRFLKIFFYKHVSQIQAEFAKRHLKVKRIRYFRQFCLHIVVGTYTKCIDKFSNFFLKNYMLISTTLETEHLQEDIISSNTSIIEK